MLMEVLSMVRTLLSAAALAAALSVTPHAALAQGLTIEVRPSGPPAWLDPPNTPIPGEAGESQRRLVYEMMTFQTDPASTAAPERYGRHLLPRGRQMGDLPPSIEFDD